MFKKLLLSILIFSLLATNFLSLFPSTAYAQDSTWYNQSYEEWHTKVFDENTPDEIFGERYTFAQVEWVVYSIAALLTGHNELLTCFMESTDPFNPLAPDNCIDKFKDAASKLISSSEINEGKNIWLATFTERPISSVAYFKDIASRLKIIPEAKAQGFGFGAASPVLALWRMVRNVTYFLLIVIIIVMAFMIMFRVKISPQTVITVQSALPKVILALILITFSYAIAGFLIDLMYVVIGLLAGIISSSGIVSSPYADDWGQMFKALTDRNLFITMGLYHLWFMAALLVSIASSGFFSAIIGVLLYGLFYPVILILTGLLLLFVLFRILWLLLKTYVNILLLVILGPIQILIGALGFGGFGIWLRGILANLAVYPTVGFMFVMAFVFLRGAYWQWESLLFGAGSALLDEFFPFAVTQQLTGPSWNPPLTVGSGQLELVWLGASLVVILMIPKVADIIKSLIERKPFPYGTAIGEAFGPAVWPISAGFSAGRAGLADYAATKAADEKGIRWRLLSSALKAKR